MTVRLHLTGHWEKPGGQMVEVFDGDRFVAGIYPDAHGVRVVSKHLAVEGIVDPIFPPAFSVKLVQPGETE